MDCFIFYQGNSTNNGEQVPCGIHKKSILDQIVHGIEVTQERVVHEPAEDDCIEGD